jgi:hypothetical protein
MATKRNLNISFKENDLYLLNELIARSSQDYVSKSGTAIDLIKKGIKYEQREKNSREESKLLEAKGI